jgi:hypothetical protein
MKNPMTRVRCTALAGTLAWIGLLPGCAGPSTPPRSGDPACSTVEVGGEACAGFWPYGVTVPPDLRFRVDGTPTAEVGRESPSCTCVEPRLEEACAALGFPDGCPSEAELTEADGYDETWTELWTCSGADRWYAVHEHLTYSDVCYGDGAPTDLFGAVEYLWFWRGELIAIELEPPPDAGAERASWCCNGTMTDRRWIGAPIPATDCVPMNLPCSSGS